MDAAQGGQFGAAQSRRFPGRFKRCWVQRINHGGTITAYVQHCKVLMCSIGAIVTPAYVHGVAVDPKYIEEAKALAGQVVAKWRDATLARMKVKANKWANCAHVSPTTITRNMDADYKSTPKIESLHLLGEAAMLPTVLDFLKWQSEGQHVMVANEALLTATFGILLDGIGIDPKTDERAQKLAEQFPGTLRRVSDARPGVVEGEGTAPEAELPAAALDLQ